MTAQRAVHIVGEVAKALDYAHRRYVLHRDIKPANLLAPNDERIFLGDFGIVRALDDAVGLTQTGVAMASVSYAAPETFSDESVDHRDDIYSLGCSLFRMLTQKTPFARPGGMAATVARNLLVEQQRLRQLRPDVLLAAAGTGAQRIECLPVTSWARYDLVSRTVDRSTSAQCKYAFCNTSSVSVAEPMIS
jgi:serine/threonine protein kinase